MFSFQDMNFLHYIAVHYTITANLIASYDQASQMFGDWYAYTWFKYEQETNILETKTFACQHIINMCDNWVIPDSIVYS